jgi:hypothetical protein
MTSDHMFVKSKTSKGIFVHTQAVKLSVIRYIMADINCQKTRTVNISFRRLYPISSQGTFLMIYCDSITLSIYMNS